ncbi:MAG: hypothetical protein EA374_01265 [Acholeplasmatales bacterium]|nr:MAG: hypothetical protein EA374_01265 [Acholeplasmatales bacterium]
MVGLFASYGFVFAIMGLATLLDKLNVLSDEGSRKFIHIGVSNWWFIALWFFERNTVWLAMVPPASFIVLNYLSYRFNLVKSMERDTVSRHDLGTVWYAVSLLVITALSFGLGGFFRIAGAMAILSMGYGDGLSALVGRHVTSRRLYGNKSLSGSLTMFAVTLLIALIGFMLIDAGQPGKIILMALLVATAGALIELFTGKGLDNLTVPLGLFALVVGLNLL